MTAEIAVFNKSAVALAADSAVTISDTNGNSPKIYNGAEKLFALSKYHPVGIMIYGSGSLCQIPWEVVVKAYRRRLGSSSFETLDAYTKDFFDFLENEDHLIPQDLRENFLSKFWSNTYWLLWSRVESRAKSWIEKEGIEPTDEETFELFNSATQQLINMLEEEDYLEGFDHDCVLQLREQVDAFIKSLIKEEQLDLELPDDSQALCVEAISLATAKDNPLGITSGVVFAGYGDKEFFPAVLAYSLKGFWGGMLRRCPDQSKSTSGGLSGLRAYAQDEEVANFMQGVSPQMYSKFEETYHDAFDKTLRSALEVLEELPDDLGIEAKKELLLKNANDAWVEASSSVEEFMRSQFIDRVVNMVEFLPKDELAYMAESLVNMTAFKRKVTNESETVGGPIDVAIISKGDGFVWIKRKHYFDKELNSHYFDHFLKGHSNDQ